MRTLLIITLLLFGFQNISSATTYQILVTSTNITIINSIKVLGIKDAIRSTWYQNTQIYDTDGSILFPQGKKVIFVTPKNIDEENFINSLIDGVKVKLYYKFDNKGKMIYSAPGVIK